jgi:hypothetical protein
MAANGGRNGGAVREHDYDDQQQRQEAAHGNEIESRLGKRQSPVAPGHRRS